MLSLKIPRFLVYTDLLGSIVAIPFVVVMVLVFVKFGLWGALAFCVLTDLGAAFIMKEISIRAGIETLVIAVFVVCRAGPATKR